MVDALLVHVKTYCTLSTQSAEAETALASVLGSLQVRTRGSDMYG